MKKYITLFLLVFGVLGLSSCRDKKYNLQKSIHITCQGDTVISYGGMLYHFDNNTYTLDNAVE